ncbi:MAG: hypothetical protein PUG48_10895 [Clostridia bacterium]|nr:hypothetical protein [Clostridia bacterium]
MNKISEEILRRFQCDYIRMLEENFAQTLAENENVRLFFINENRAFTDGRNIVVDPATDGLFYDVTALQCTSKYMNWKPEILSDKWNALHIITRAQTIHECLHILYTDFPTKAATDPICDTKIKRKVLALISNIIEDAYIEAVGCSVYDNMEFYLRFGRVSRLFLTRLSEGTAQINLKEETKQAENNPELKKQTETLLDYLEYMITFLLYPMCKLEEPPTEIAEYIEKTKQLFLDGSFAPSPDERYEYARKIYDVILPLIPDTEDDLDDERLSELIGGVKTHSPDSSTIGGEEHKSRTQTVTVRLFTDKDGNMRKEDENSLYKLMLALSEFSNHKNEALSIVLDNGFVSISHGGDFDCSVLHNHIKINETHPKINLNLRKAYQNIYNKYRVSINSYNTRFAQLLESHRSLRDEKRRFGSGINSARLGDPHKRCWYRNIDGIDVPDMSVLLLIDGSGSMQGKRRNGAVNSSIILHEVLKKQGIKHAIVEHRASFVKPEIDVNVLVDFNSRNEEKYNLMKIKADGDNRDALALFWAEKYINKHTDCENKLIIVISDGIPMHEYDEYYPPVSIKDTANAARKIIKRGTKIIAISLDEDGSYDCYEMLKEIYPQLIACNDLTRLTGQLLGLIAKLL